eukprot:TRINITY_DN111620_c0_g1_i1.p1 TRINITY_DN111620_c0_g1~~TRINITY_DN111620_c0_g1_i1.p1  ORF type:complete len:709 (-),score=127.99 TRINITY_DN111620_c0_g1_i1:192-2318(-)
MTRQFELSETMPQDSEYEEQSDEDESVASDTDDTSDRRRHPVKGRGSTKRSLLVCGATGLLIAALGVAVFALRGPTQRSLRAAFERAAPGLIQASGAEPNPPKWPASVKVFDPTDPPAVVEAAVNAFYKKNGGEEPPDNGQFSKLRQAFLFKPGMHRVNVPVGYYTQVLGLGESPDDVVFNSSKGVHCEEGAYYYKVGALNNFWRSAENFRTSAWYSWNHLDLTAQKSTPSADDPGGMLWAVSQAAPLRRVKVDRDLLLCENAAVPSTADEPTPTGFPEVSEVVVGIGMPGRASGGFMGNVQVDGTVQVGSQQQWMSRNCKVDTWMPGGWNVNFVGTEGAKPTQCGIKTRFGGYQSYVTVDETPIIAEKPFITIDTWGKYHLNVPQVVEKRRSVMFEKESVQHDFSRVYVATEADSAAMINARLSAGKHVVLSPGVYYLDAPLELNYKNQVLLGLGMATLVASKGNAVVKVGNVGGVRVAGILMEAGPVLSETLLEWGDSKFEGSRLNPGLLHDVFARVGGPSPDAKARTMLQIKSGYVIGDNVWLWRADHGKGYVTKNGQNPCDVGAVVTGDHVTMYGLFSEHNLHDQVQWAGDNGEVYLLQTEMPYDATSDFGTNGYTALRVGDTVTSHKAYGVGVYHYFRDHSVTVKSGIVTPEAVANSGSIVAPVAICLNGKGVMQHVLNDIGDTTSMAVTKEKGVFSPAYCCG